jgi:hypothetical protein
MKNKTLAIFGIGTYILSVLTSASDLAGNFKFPVALIVISGILELIFIAIATIRIWKESKLLSILLVSSYIILCIFLAIQEVVTPSYGSPLIILLNIAKVIHIIVFVCTIIKLFKMK